MSNNHHDPDFEVTPVVSAPKGTKDANQNARWAWEFMSEIERIEFLLHIGATREVSHGDVEYIITLAQVMEMS